MIPSAFKERIYYGWVVVVTFAVVGTAIWGIRYTFGVFFKSIETEFVLGRAATSAIYSAQMVLGGVFAILGGWALDRYGPRRVFLLMGLFTGLSLLLSGQAGALWQLFFTYSLFLAMGTSAIYVGVMSTVSRWFSRRKGLALGIASIGAGLGPLVLAPFATHLIASFDWRTAFSILGLVAVLVVVPLSRLLRKDPEEVGLRPDGADTAGLAYDRGAIAQHLSLRQAFRTRSFWLVVSSFFLFAASLFLVVTHLVPHIMDIGFSPAQAAAVLSLMGGATIIGRLLLGIASDRLGRKMAAVLCTSLQVGAMLWLLWSREMWAFYLFAIMFGLAWGGMGPTMAAIIGDSFGLRQLGAILGVLDAGFNTGAAVGPALGGLIFDFRQSYFLAFLLGALAMVVTTMLILLIRPETDRGRR